MIKIYPHPEKKKEIKDQKYLPFPLKIWNIFHTDNKQSKIKKCDLKNLYPPPPQKKIPIPALKKYLCPPPHPSEKKEDMKNLSRHKN